MNKTKRGGRLHKPIEATHHHANVIACAVSALFDRIINDDIHERIKSTQNTRNRTATVQFQHHTFVHEPGRGEKCQRRLQKT